MSSNKVKLGQIGERLAAEYYGVSINENFYDTEKDLVLPNGETIEVKTQNRYPGKNLFSMRASVDRTGLNNILKCMSVDHLVFVEYDSSDIIKLWECTNRKVYQIYTTSQMLTMVGFPIANMKLLHSINDPHTAAQMRALSQSKQFK